MRVDLTDAPPHMTGFVPAHLTLDAFGSGDFARNDVVLSTNCVQTLVDAASISPACIADFDNNDGIDGGDVEAFMTLWAAGDASTDVDGSGGADGGDVEVFFRRWAAGC